jgi:hypothetical protein
MKLKFHRYRNASILVLTGNMSNSITVAAIRYIPVKQLKNEFTVRLGSLEIKDSIPTEPAQKMTFFTTKKRDQVAILTETYSGIVSTPIDVFTMLEAGCEHLGHANE